jgi:hypothetical protein
MNIEFIIDARDSFHREVTADRTGLCFELGNTCPCCGGTELEYLDYDLRFDDATKEEDYSCSECGSMLTCIWDYDYDLIAELDYDKDFDEMIGIVNDTMDYRTTIVVEDCFVNGRMAYSRNKKIDEILN